MYYAKSNIWFLAVHKNYAYSIINWIWRLVRIFVTLTYSGVVVYYILIVLPLSEIFTNKLKPSEDFSRNFEEIFWQKSLALVLESTSKAWKSENPYANNLQPKHKYCNWCQSDMNMSDYKPEVLLKHEVIYLHLISAYITVTALLRLCHHLHTWLYTLKFLDFISNIRNCKMEMI